VNELLRQINEASVSRPFDLWPLFGFIPAQSPKLGNGWKHDGHKDGIQAGVFAGEKGDCTIAVCHACGVKGSFVNVWLHTHPGTPFPEALREVARIIGIQESVPSQLPARTDQQKQSAAPPSWGESDIKCSYDYTDEAGRIIFQVLRMIPGPKFGDEKKPFRQRRPDGNGGWIRSIEGIKPRPLYHLPELLRAEKDETIIIAEGEKDVDALRALGFYATTSSGGSNSPNKTDWTYFGGRHAVIIKDRDDAGEDYADSVSDLLKLAGVESVIVTEVKVGKDPADYIESGADAAAIRALWTKRIHASEVDLTAELDRGEVVVSKYNIPADRIPTGLIAFDAWTAGFPKKKLILLAAMPGAGKTTLVARWALNAAYDGKRVLCLSGEMKPTELKTLMSFSLAGVDRTRLPYGLHQQTLDKVQAAEREIDTMPIEFDVFGADDETENTTEEISRKVRDCDLCIVDPITYVGIMSAGKKQDWSRPVAIARKLKDIAEERDICCLAIGHLNRQAAAAFVNDEEQGFHQLAGAYLIDAVIDLGLVLQKRKDPNVNRILAIEKARFCRDGGRFPLRYDSAIARFIELDVSELPSEFIQKKRRNGSYES
jgi:5S rRNA maturation endonuclease (ribonuclease M5)